MKNSCIFIIVLLFCSAHLLAEEKQKEEIKAGIEEIMGLRLGGELKETVKGFKLVNYVPEGTIHSRGQIIKGWNPYEIPELESVRVESYKNKISSINIVFKNSTNDVLWTNIIFSFIKKRFKDPNNQPIGKEKLIRTSYIDNGIEFNVRLYNEPNKKMIRYTYPLLLDMAAADKELIVKKTKEKNKFMTKEYRRAKSIVKHL